MTLLEGKVAVVTGAGSGIGRATALRMAQEGAKVVAADVQADAGAQTASSIKAAGGEAMFCEMDVSRPEDVERLIRTAVQAYGRVDVLVNNAGIEGELGKRLADCSIENFDRIISVNLRGVFLGMKYAIPQMQAQGSGSIVNIASTAGILGTPELGAYSASKGGVVQLTRTGAVEYVRDNIRINAICPGGVNTAITERIRAFRTSRGEPERSPVHADPTNMGRSSDPSEIAAAVVFLASDEASFVTGLVMPVDGGISAS